MPDKPLCQRQIASALLEKNERTVHRWCKDGILTAMDVNKHGTPLFDIDAVLALCGNLASANAQLVDLIVAADQGSAVAQNDLGIVLLQSGRKTGALTLFSMAAAQAYPDAMHFLYRCHREGLGTDADDTIALMWLSKAAVQGHKIARMQLDAMRTLSEQALRQHS